MKTRNGTEAMFGPPEYPSEILVNSASHVMNSDDRVMVFVPNYDRAAYLDADSCLELAAELIARANRIKGPLVADSGNHTFEVTPELFAWAIATAGGALDGKRGSKCWVTEQGGSKLPVMIVEHDSPDVPFAPTFSFAFLISDMLTTLGMELPRVK